MYVSDYGYAAPPSAWTTTLFDYGGNDANGESIPAINWLYLGINEWTISRRADYSSRINVSSSDALDGEYNDVANSNFNIRTPFYLSSSVTYASGNSTQNSPFRIGN